jgi:hypothetical protein
VTRRTLIVALLVAAALPAVAVADGSLVTTISSGPPSPVASSSATFAFAASDPGASFGCALDQAAFTSCAPPVTLTDVPDGQHTFFVIAQTGTTQEATPAYWTWTVDTTPPAAVTASHAAVGYKQLVLSWEAPADADHVVVLRGSSAKKAATTQVYSGPASSYTEVRFVNARFHRYSITSFDKAGNASPAVQVEVPASTLLLAPADGSTLHSKKPQLFRWRAVPKATYYNIQLWRGGLKVLTSWPDTPSFRLPASWRSQGHRYRLTHGYYTWFVWPGFGPRADGHYGDLVGHALFRAAG